MSQTLTSKQRAYLMSLASNLDVILNIGKASLTEEIINAVNETFNTRELIKIGVLKNCIDDPRAIAEAIAENTGATVVKVIGKKIILYKRDKDNQQIMLPR
ncbi:MAG: ribosome assembly RNA-binding protein YhbY [Lachnospiraceae bacterium]|nr:ribosome assembly RNA-binding protein YhbY [Lachnospiraceae bacterium]